MGFRERVCNGAVAFLASTDGFHSGTHGSRQMAVKTNGSDDLFLFTSSEFASQLSHHQMGGGQFHDRLSSRFACDGVKDDQFVGAQLLQIQGSRLGWRANPLEAISIENIAGDGPLAH